MPFTNCLELVLRNPWLFSSIPLTTANVEKSSASIVHVQGLVPLNLGFFDLKFEANLNVVSEGFPTISVVL
jgi:hypothetical protein